MISAPHVQAPTQSRRDRQALKMAEEPSGLLLELHWNATFVDKVHSVVFHIYDTNRSFPHLVSFSVELNKVPDLDSHFGILRCLQCLGQGSTSISRLKCLNESAGKIHRSQQPADHEQTWELILSKFPLRKQLCFQHMRFWIVWT
jgi:hypothetical protein